MPATCPAGSARGEHPLPGCQETLIERIGYLIRGYHLTPEGRCPKCQTAMPGIWPANPSEVWTGDLSEYGRRLPRPVR